MASVEHASDPDSGSAAGNRHFYHDRAKEFVELHDQVQTSVNLLDALETFLSTFQKDLSAVSGQISELQDRSKSIDDKLKSRRKIEKPLSNLLSDITIPPALATTILDSAVGESWLPIVEDFERRLDTMKARPRVKAARDLGEVAEGLRIVAATKLRAFFLALFQPIRGNVTTNMQVIQTSVLLKYKSLFSFLQRQAPNVAQEVQRSYIGAARVYYETGFRRYVRSLGWLKARSSERFEPIVVGEKEKDLAVDLKRLELAKIDGPGVVLAYMADDKVHKEPIEALLRSLLLVLMDNITAEYTFVKSFFLDSTPLLSSRGSDNALLSPSGLLSPDRASFAEQKSITGSDYGGPRRNRADSIAASMSGLSLSQIAQEEQVSADAIWKQIVDPILEYSQTFVQSVLDPMPAAVPLLTMIRLTEDVVAEVQSRKCSPLESFMFSLRLKMWPVFQKAMSEHIEALKKLADGANGGYFSRAAATTDALISNICDRYVVMFNSFVVLTAQEEETMIFSNLLRLRNELAKLIPRHTSKIADPITKATSQSAIYESLLQGLSKGSQLQAHPKAQQEIAYWSNLEEEARRKIIAVKQTKSTGR